MRISTQTKNAISVLVHCARRPGEACRIADVARACGMTDFSAFKLISHLVRSGFLESIRGRGGGVRFTADPRSVTLGSVIRATDPNFSTPDQSPDAGSFEQLVDDAVIAFTEIMDGHTVADLMGDPDPVREGVSDGQRQAACRPDDQL
jgi:Rrf2 family protein